MSSDLLLARSTAVEVHPPLMRASNTLPVGLFPHAVILHRDTALLVDTVAFVLTFVVTVLTDEEAGEIAQTALEFGRAVVIECPQEAAEHYQLQLTAYGLTVTVEEAP